MGIIKQLSSVMVHTTAYRLWQAPFARAKLAPAFQHNNFDRIKRVLDVGCGPGTNCQYFHHTDYTGFDINPGYIRFAKERYRRNFLVQDVCTFEPQADEERFDFVLVNSLLHHLNDDQSLQILGQICKLLSPDGFVHIVELVLPAQRGLPRLLATNDRGDFPRSLPAWEQIFNTHFRNAVFEPYSIKLLGIDLWNLVYFKGAPKV